MERRWNGWGYQSVNFELPETAARRLTARIGEGIGLRSVCESDVLVAEARALPGLGLQVATDPFTRLRHSCGQSFPDLCALRSGKIVAFPDGVAFPESQEEIQEIVQSAGRHNIGLVIRGGGTSVVDGVTISAEDRPCVVLSLERLSGLLKIDVHSRLATFWAGTLGKDVEAALRPHGLSLGHEPQSFEFSTIGGWVATRSSGHRSVGVGRIDDLVAGMELVNEHGPWLLSPVPSAGTGPEMRRLLIGSEGRFGIITKVTVRVRALPPSQDGEVVLFPNWQNGLEASRKLLQDGVPIEVLRLSDATETAFATALLNLSPLASNVSEWLRNRLGYSHCCALLIAWAGKPADVRHARSASARIWRTFRGIGIGRGGWHRWSRDRFLHPYLRESLLDRGWAIDTLETAASWTTLPTLYERVREALRSAAQALGFRIEVLCHLSHVYPDGGSLYFTFLWPIRDEALLDQWASLKHAATTAILQAGGVLSHHHGIGKMHAPYLEQEIAPQGIAVLRSITRTLDPLGVLNSEVMFSSTDSGLSPAPSPTPSDRIDPEAS